MNEMKMLRDHRDAQPGPTPDAIAQARARLTDQAHLTARRPRRPMPSRRWRYALIATAVVGAAAAAAVAPAVLGGQDTSRAYAAERLPNGTIRVTLHEFTDSAGLQRRLNALGVHAAVDYLPSGWLCAAGRATIDVTANQPAVIEDDQAHVAHPRPTKAGDRIFYIHPDRIKPGQTLVWIMTYDHAALSRRAGYVVTMSTYLARGPVKPCKPVPLDTLPGSTAEHGRS
ncbi:hypothetical protein [Actinoallomurus sp. NPDC050550]|uniref:hypothetical protein n=1 Tax=Actinoallomurus sp. NPDC050550 TaxID=3154937 RepID=UPI0033F983F4